MSNEIAESPSTLADATSEDTGQEDSTLREDSTLVAIRAAVACALDRKAEDVKVLDLVGLTQVADYFVLCSGANPRQVQAISDAVERKLRDLKVRPRHIEGYRRGRWILLDYLDFVLHVFHQEERTFYSLDRLWSDATDITAKVLPATEKKKADATASSDF
ncbi:MAG: ribosome silencing factor [Thermoanaerobaculia bacterium]|nr:ribosome silencing factor [Thermoanaerobaculia bacterium]